MIVRFELRKTVQMNSRGNILQNTLECSGQ